MSATPRPTPQRLGLIAGEGTFPIAVLRGAKAAGLDVVAIGLKGCCPGAIQKEADVFYEAGIAQLGRWIRLLRREQVSQAVMAGRVRKRLMLDAPWWRQWLAYLPDWTSIRVWYFAAKDRRNDTLLRAVADELQRKGVALIDSTKYCPTEMAPDGVLTRRQPSAAQRADAELGWQIAREIGRLDIGQAVAVKDKDVIAVEAIEGTDAMIERAGALCRTGGWTLVKVAKPNQDLRFDVPAIGPQTIRNMAAARAGCLVIESGKTLLLEREETLRLADERGIAVLGRRDAPGTTD